MTLPAKHRKPSPSARCGSRGPRRALTLMEMTVSLVIASILLAGLMSVAVIGSRSIERDIISSSRLSQGQDVIEEVMEDVRLSVDLQSYDATSIAMTVPDRTDDGIPEVIEYRWGDGSGAPGAGSPLQRRVGSGSWVTLLDDVASLNFNYTHRTVNGPGYEEAADPITLQQTVKGGSPAISPIVLPAISGGTDQAYVLLIAHRDGPPDITVAGGGLIWSQQVGQCGANGDSAMSIWTAFGSPPTDFQVVITYVSWNALSAVLLRYSGVGSFFSALGANTLGPGGGCSGGTENDSPSIALTSVEPGSIHLVGFNHRRKNVNSALPAYDFLAKQSQGAGQHTTQISVYQRVAYPPGADTFTAKLGGSADWSAAGIILSPAP